MPPRAVEEAEESAEEPDEASDPNIEVLESVGHEQHTDMSTLSDAQKAMVDACAPLRPPGDTYLDVSVFDHDDRTKGWYENHDEGVITIFSGDERTRVALHRYFIREGTRLRRLVPHVEGESVVGFESCPWDERRADCHPLPSPNMMDAWRWLLSNRLAGVVLGETTSLWDSRRDTPEGVRWLGRERPRLLDATDERIRMAVVARETKRVFAIEVELREGRLVRFIHRQLAGRGHPAFEVPRLRSEQHVAGTTLAIRTPEGVRIRGSQRDLWVRFDHGYHFHLSPGDFRADRSRVTSWLQRSPAPRNDVEVLLDVPDAFVFEGREPGYERTCEVVAGVQVGDQWWVAETNGALVADGTHYLDRAQCGQVVAMVRSLRRTEPE